MNDLLHTWHLNGFSPVCVRWCRTSELRLGNHFIQYSHMCPRRFSCVGMWRASWMRRENASGQVSHWKIFISPFSSRSTGCMSSRSQTATSPPCSLITSILVRLAVFPLLNLYLKSGCMRRPVLDSMAFCIYTNQLDKLIQIHSFIYDNIKTNYLKTIRYVVVANFFVQHRFTFLVNIHFIGWLNFVQIL